MVVNMATVNFSKPVKRELDKAGWSSLRHVDITNLKSLLVDKGFDVSGYAEDILSKFSGLKIESNEKWIRFDASEAARAFGSQDVRLLTHAVGGVCPIGTTSSAYVFMSPGGECQLLDQDWLFIKTAISLTKLLDSIFLGHPFARTVELAPDERPVDLR
jgi:hypothetical protein